MNADQCVYVNTTLEGIAIWVFSSNASCFVQVVTAGVINYVPVQ